MAWLNHYDMERKSLESYLGILALRFVQGERFDREKFSYVLDVDATLSALRRNHIRLFDWVKQSCSSRVNEDLDNAILRWFPSYKIESDFNVEFDELVRYITNSCGPTNPAISKGADLFKG